MDATMTANLAFYDAPRESRLADLATPYERPVHLGDRYDRDQVPARDDVSDDYSWRLTPAEKDAMKAELVALQEGAGL